MISVWLRSYTCLKSRPPKRYQKSAVASLVNYHLVQCDLINGLCLSFSRSDFGQDQTAKKSAQGPAGRCVDFGVRNHSEHCVHCSINSNNPRRQDLIMCKANSTLNNVSLSPFPPTELRVSRRLMFDLNPLFWSWKSATNHNLTLATPC